MTASSTPQTDFAEPLGAAEVERRGTADVLGGPTNAAADPLEARVVAAAAGGDEEAFRFLVERHQDPIFRLCVQWLGCPEDAREACQDTFVRAHRALERFEPRARFSTWLYRIAVNQCRDRMRSTRFRMRRAQRPIDDHEAPVASPGSPPDEAAAAASDLARLEEGLRALPRRLREVLVLHGVHALSQRECAEILGCSERAVEGRLYRARRRLAAWLRGRP